MRDSSVGEAWIEIAMWRGAKIDGVRMGRPDGILLAREDEVN